MGKGKNWDVVFDYAQGMIDGTILANKYRRLGAKRFIDDYKSGNWDFNADDADVMIQLIETSICHMQGEDKNGNSLRGTPFLLMPFHKFIIYNLYGFKLKGTNINRFVEGIIFIPRKNVKTSFAGALSFAHCIRYRKSASKTYIVAAALKQTMEYFEFMKYNIDNMGENADQGGHFRIIDNNNEHSISGEIGGGFVGINALASNPDAQDSFNCNFAIADEVHAFKKPKQYTLFKDAQKTYRNKLMLGISTAGDDPNSFLAQKVTYGKRVLDGQIKDDRTFFFIAEADPIVQDDGSSIIDYTNPRTHEMANPAYGESIQPEELIEDAKQAQNDPQLRKDFFAKSLNVFTSSMDTYFDIELVKQSDEKYDWSLEELAKLPIVWYGGADLSKLHDLTGVCLHGRYKDVDIVIAHAFIPVSVAHLKADEDNIPFFWWEEEGWLTMCNSNVIEYEDPVKWFVSMRNIGFKIKLIGYDRRYSREFIMKMKKAKFVVRDQSQRYTEKTEAFREIEKQIINQRFYYCHNKAYEYCIENVKAIEDSDEFVRYQKIQPTLRIDLFDSDVIAVKQMLLEIEKSQKVGGWFG